MDGWMDGHGHDTHADYLMLYRAVKRVIGRAVISSFSPTTWGRGVVALLHVVVPEDNRRLQCVTVSLKSYQTYTNASDVK